MRTNVTPNAVQAIYKDSLGRSGQSQYIMNWVNYGMSLDEIKTAVRNSTEGKEYAASNAPELNPIGTDIVVDDSGMGGAVVGGGKQAPLTDGPIRGVIVDDTGMFNSPTATTETEATPAVVGGGKQAPLTYGPIRVGSSEASPPPDTTYTPSPTMAEVNALYNQFLGRDGKPEYLQAWIDSGQDINQLANSIRNSKEGLEYAANQSAVVVDEGPDEASPDGSPNQGNQSVLDAIKAQQEAYQAQQASLMAQLAAQQQAQQEMFSQYGQSAKGGTNQQGQQQKPMFAAGDGTGNMTGGTGIQPPNPYGQNPYSSGYGMGYQSPGMAGQ